MLDMKSGVAAGMAVLQAFSEQAEREGNLLLVATPDEEENSCGMRGAATFLPGFLKERGLHVPLAINLDSTCDPGDGRDGRIVTMGTIGKLLLSAFVVGKDSHACYPFDGVNAAYLAAELAVEFEGSPDLGEVTNGEIASPPTALASKDGKSVYNVTTPGRAWLFWNVLIHNRRPADIFAIARRKAEQTVARAGRRMTERAASLDASIRSIRSGSRSAS
jgi:arginine utilization protein RocB